MYNPPSVQSGCNCIQYNSIKLHSANNFLPKIWVWQKIIQLLFLFTFYLFSTDLARFLRIQIFFPPDSNQNLIKQRQVTVIHPFRVFLQNNLFMSSLRVTKITIQNFTYFLQRCISSWLLLQRSYVKDGILKLEVEKGQWLWQSGCFWHHT